MSEPKGSFIIFLVVGPLRWGGGIKHPEPLRKKNSFFSMIKKKCPESHNTRKNVKKKLLFMFSTEPKIDQPKNVI